MSTLRMTTAEADDRCFGVYVRRSDEDDSGRSRSCEDQELTGKRFAASQGFPPERIRVYREDEGVKGWWWFRQSGREGPYREELSRMISDLEDGVLGGCWCWRSDRLVRDTEVALALAPYLIRNKAKLWAGFREIDTSTADGLYNLTIEAAANRRQRDRSSEDGVRDKLYRAEFGLFTRDPSCYGWRSGGRESQEAVPQWHEIAVTEMMMRWFVYGDGGAPLNLGQIATRLMDLDIPLSVSARGHKARDPKLVTFAQVRSVITNPMFVAKWRHRGEEYDFWGKLAVSKGGAPRSTAIPVDIFEAVKARLIEIERPGMANDRTDRLCSGLAVCACCGMTMHVNVKAFVNGEKLQRFYCAHRTGRRKTCIRPGYASLAVDELDSWVVGQLAPQLADELRIMRAELTSKPLQKELQLAERRLSEARRNETERLTALVCALDSDQISAVATQLRAERQRAERVVEELKEKIKQAGENVDEQFSSLQSVCKARLREALRRAVRFIAIGKNGVTVLTRTGTYIVAPIMERDLTLYSEAENRRRIEQVALVGGPGQILNHAEFISGRRRSLGKAADRLADDQLLPP